MDNLIKLNKLNQETPNLLHVVYYHGDCLYTIINGRLIIGADYYDFIEEVKIEFPDYQYNSIIVEDYV